MLDIIYTDAEHVEQGVLSGCIYTSTHGNVENSFEAVFGARNAPDLSNGCFIYCEGTEYGGIVRDLESRTDDGTKRFKGPTWHGVINQRFIEPLPGKTHFIVNCDANDALGQIIDHIGLSDVFKVDSSPAGFNVKAEIRFRRAYDAIIAMLSKAGGKLCVRWQRNYATLSAAKAATWDSMNSSNADFTIRKCLRPPNHLLCLGKGEMLARLVCHVYADENGVISSEQSLFGLDEVMERYVSTEDTLDGLYAEGVEELEKLQGTDEVDMSSELVDDYAVGDLVSVANLEANQSATAVVTSKTVTIADGMASFSCDVGSASDLLGIEEEME